MDEQSGNFDDKEHLVEFQPARFTSELGLPPADDQLLRDAATSVRQEFRDCSKWKRLRCRKVSIFSERDRGTVYVVHVGKRLLASRLATFVRGAVIRAKRFFSIPMCVSLVNVALSRAREAIIVLASRSEMDEPYLKPLIRRLTPSHLTGDVPVRWKTVSSTLTLQQTNAASEVDESKVAYKTKATAKCGMGNQIAQRKDMKPVLSQEQQRLTNLNLDGKLLLSVVEQTDANDTNSRSAHIFYDNAQNIYGRKTPKWSEFGLDLRGRSTIMRESFRSTTPIAEPAVNILHRLTTADQRQDQKELMGMGLIEKSERNGEEWLGVRFNQIDGPKPIFHAFDSRHAEMQAIFSLGYGRAIASGPRESH